MNLTAAARMRSIASGLRLWKSRFAILSTLFLLAPATAVAHKASDSYLTLRNTATVLEGEWHLALRDLEDAVGLDANDDGRITWGELRSRREAVTAYALSRLSFKAGGRTGSVRLVGFQVDRHSDGAYAVLRFLVDGWNGASALEISYHAFFDLDLLHRGLLRWEEGGATRLAVFGPETRVQQFPVGASARRSALPAFLREGVWHIWTGYDHLLFLLALLLPGVLRREIGTWEPVQAARPAFVNVLKIVTAFTVAHSITLSIAAMGLVHLPSRLVESAIAASVVIAAWNNVTPFFAERGWLAAFGFGLLHGFGFANALRDLGLRPDELAATLFGFNCGVELGQLAIVAVFLPLAFPMRGLFLYRVLVLRAGSLAIMMVATTWFAERAFDFKWLPF